MAMAIRALTSERLSRAEGISRECLQGAGALASPQLELVSVPAKGKRHGEGMRGRQERVQRSRGCRGRREQ